MHVFCTYYLFLFCDTKTKSQRFSHALRTSHASRTHHARVTHASRTHHARSTQNSTLFASITHASLTRCARITHALRTHYARIRAKVGEPEDYDMFFSSLAVQCLKPSVHTHGSQGLPGHRVPETCQPSTWKPQSVSPGSCSTDVLGVNEKPEKPHIQRILPGGVSGLKGKPRIQQNAAFFIAQ